MSLFHTAPALPAFSLARQRRDTLFLLGILALITGHLALLLPPWAAVLSLVLLGWRAALAWWSRPMPHRAVLALVLLAALAGSVIEAVRGSISGGALTLLLVLIPLKTLEMHQRRDLFVVFFLGFFGIVANFLFTQSIVVAVLMMLGFVGLLTALVNAHKPVGAAPLRESARTAGMLLVLGLPMIAVLYVGFPRFPPLWGLPIQQNTARTGLSDDMTVGNMASLAQDQSVAMRIRFLPGSPLPQQHDLYFRGPVLSRIEGNHWSAGEPAGTAPGAPLGSPYNPIEPLGTAVRYEVLLEPHQRRWMLPLDATPTQPSSDYRAHMTQELVWQSYRPITTAMRYTATSYHQYRNARHTPEEALRRYLQLPAGDNPRTRAWAQELRQQFGAPDAQGQSQHRLIDHVLGQLRQQDYRYTLTPGVYGPDGADDFWFTRREGFCEHIASAFAILMRGSGIPARIVTGYQGGEPNPVDGVWTVRQSDAHAWVEVWLPDNGWSRIDPTAAISPQRVSLSRTQALNSGGEASFGRAALPPDWLWNMRTVMEAIDYRWAQWVLNYNQEEQENLLARLGLPRLNWSQILIIAVTLASLSALLYLASPWLLRRRHQDHWLRLLEQTRHRLAQSGLTLPPQLPPRSMAEATVQFFGHTGTPVAQWLQQMDRFRYATQPASPAASRQQLKQLTRQWKQLSWPAPPAPSA
ncbi:Transglutaminase-like superfamily protein [Lampropedia hyalina DSM 16112]|jgi:hypothetical protein|uniref:Transglutaminase-like superfamily protein n=1 Tax=Lampropedia hyalina DSM 16112 TaxID=1122156 RepID=A0A1M5CF34_9BURK|nr:DUF3488 and transglutaminase-like domain-containing protein [Lampropedia hyalina]SHF53345.1 Transglutaminase-like superfamily protein [Lampropedia hyalina DSM 16112]